MRTAQGATVKVWDPLVRTGHWVLVIAFAVAYLTEGEPEWLHTLAGYAIAVTVTVRVVWGFVGPRHARFSSFVTGPSAVIGYLASTLRGTSKRYIGHSPAGGAMTLALLAVLAFTAFTGMATLAAEEGEGPLAGIVQRVPAETRADGQAPGEAADEDDDEAVETNGERGESMWAEVHEVSANLALFLIVLHLCGVALASYVHRENLPRSMVTGHKRA